MHVSMIFLRTKPVDVYSNSASCIRTNKVSTLSVRKITTVNTSPKIRIPRICILRLFKLGKGWQTKMQKNLLIYFLCI